MCWSLDFFEEYICVVPDNSIENSVNGHTHLQARDCNDILLLFYLHFI